MRLLFLVLSFIFFVYCATIPKYLQFPCERSDPDIEECTQEYFEKFWPTIVRGIPELGVPQLDPIVIKSLTFNQAINNIVTVNAHVNNLKVIGLKNLKIDAVKADLYKYYGVIRVSVPRIYVEADYNAIGRVFIGEIKSRGKLQGNFNNCQFVVEVTLKPYLKDGVEYLKVDKINQVITIGDGQIKIVASNREGQNMADFVSNFFNNNPQGALATIIPIAKEFSEKYSRQELDKVLSQYPSSQWLPK